MDWFFRPEVITANCALILSGCSVALVAIQIRLFVKQLRLDALLRVSASNREILVLGYEHPELFDVVSGLPVTNEKQRRYLQLWLNHMDSLWNAERQGLFDAEDAEAHRRDIGDFFEMVAMRDHWQLVKLYYPKAFRQYIDGIIRERISPPP